MELDVLNFKEPVDYFSSLTNQNKTLIQKYYHLYILSFNLFVGNFFFLPNLFNVLMSDKGYFF